MDGDDVVIWTNPEDKHETFTVGDIYRAFSVENLLLAFMADLEDGHVSETKAIEDLFEECEKLGISPDPCPICGRYSEHSHSID